MIGGDSQDGAGESLALFRNPSHAFQPAAYWFWHRLPHADQLASQLAEFSQAGFGTIMIQARLAFPRADYLSADYLAAYREAVEIAAGLGLKIGLYDDYNWISGHAGGRTVEGSDDLRERHLFWSSTRAPAGAISGIASPFIEAMGPDIARWQYEDGNLAWTEWTVVAALLHPEDCIEDDRAVADVAARVILTEQSDQSCRFTMTGDIPEGYAVTVFISARARTSRLINYLLPEAAERFIEVGLDPFATALRGLMPDPVRVLFFDQPGPGFYRWDQHSGNLGNSALYSETLREAFAARREAPFALALLALVRDVGPRTASLRCAFYETYAGMMHEAFLGTLAKWARRHGLELSGHEILAHVGAWGLNQGFRSIDPRVAIGVDHFGVDGFRTETAVDANNFEAQLAPKLGDSVARAHGRSRCVVETYATSLHADVRASGQWDLTLATMRAQAIRLAFLGARQFLIHALWQTDGFDADDRPFVNPRFDFAPGINFEPWWPYTSQFSTETARLSAFIEPATPLTRVAILYPLHTAWAKGPLHDHGAHFGAWCRHLNALSCDYLIIDERGLDGATFAERRLRISGCGFDAIVLPSAAVLKTCQTLTRIAEFQSNGIALWTSGDEPRCLNACDNGAPAFKPDRRLQGVPSQGDVGALIATLPAIGPRISLPPETSISRWVGFEPDGRWRLALFNDGESEASIEIGFADGVESERWDPRTGLVSPIARGRILELRLEPHELVCLRMRQIDAAAAIAPAAPAMTVESVTTLDASWSLLAPGADHAVRIAVDRGWELQGFPALSGSGLYEREIVVDEAGFFALDLPLVHTAVTVALDGHEIARLGWPPYRVALGRLEAGVYRLTLAVSNTAANRYYAGTPYRGARDEPSGLGAPPLLIRLHD